MSVEPLADVEVRMREDHLPADFLWLSESDLDRSQSNAADGDLALSNRHAASPMKPT